MMSVPIMITADEVNCLVHAYLQDSGFQHSAYTVRMEGRLDQSPYFRKHIPRGELVDLLSKALLYLEVEAHWKADAMTVNCKTGFSLLDTHVCSLEPPVKGTFPSPLSVSAEKAPEPTPKTNGAGDASKRKASTPSTEEGRAEKRQRTEEREVDNIPPRNDSTKPTVASPADSKKAKPKRITRPIEDPNSSNYLAVSLLQGHKREVFNCAWNPTKHNVLATGSKDGIVNIWDLPEAPHNSSIDCGPSVTLSEFSKDDDADITALNWNSDGKLLAIGSYDAVLRVYTHDGDLFFSGSQHNGPIFAVRFSQDDRWILTASLDGLACVWDVHTRKLYKQWQCHRDCALDVDWLDNMTFATAGSDGVIHIMKVLEAKPIKTLTGHAEDVDVNQIECNPSRTRLASCSDDQTIRIWNVSKSNLLNRSPDAIPGLQSSDRVVVLKGHTNYVCGITWCSYIPSDSNEILATSSFDRTVRLWDSVTGECLHVFSDHKRPVYALTFSPNGRQLVTAGGEGMLNVYDTKQRKKLWTWHASADKPGIYEVDWQQSGNLNRIAFALENRSIGVVDVTRIPVLQD